MAQITKQSIHDNQNKEKSSPRYLWNFYFKKSIIDNQVKNIHYNGSNNGNHQLHYNYIALLIKLVLEAVKKTGSVAIAPVGPAINFDHINPCFYIGLVICYYYYILFLCKYNTNNKYLHRNR